MGWTFGFSFDANVVLVLVVGDGGGCVLVGGEWCGCGIGGGI